MEYFLNFFFFFLFFWVSLPKKAEQTREKKKLEKNISLLRLNQGLNFLFVCLFSWYGWRNSCLKQEQSLKRWLKREANISTAVNWVTTTTTATTTTTLSGSIYSLSSWLKVPAKEIMLMTINCSLLSLLLLTYICTSPFPITWIAAALLITRQENWQLCCGLNLKLLLRLKYYDWSYEMRK